MREEEPLNIRREELKFKIEDIFDSVYDLDIQIWGNEELHFEVLEINLEQFNALHKLINENNYTIRLEWAYDTRCIEVQIGNIKPT